MKVMRPASSREKGGSTTHPLKICNYGTTRKAAARRGDISCEQGRDDEPARKAEAACVKDEGGGI